MVMRNGLLGIFNPWQLNLVIRAAYFSIIPRRQKPPGKRNGSWLLPVAGAGGLAGSLFDSLLGATVQAIYYSSSRQKETEKKIDPDGTPNTLVRGWRWLDNDLVNFLSSLVGAAVAALVWGVIAR